MSGVQQAAAIRRAREEASDVLFESAYDLGIAGEPLCAHDPTSTCGYREGRMQRSLIAGNDWIPVGEEEVADGSATG